MQLRQLVHDVPLTESASHSSVINVAVQDIPGNSEYEKGMFDSTVRIKVQKLILCRRPFSLLLTGLMIQRNASRIKMRRSSLSCSQKYKRQILKTINSPKSFCSRKALETSLRVPTQHQQR